MNRLLAAGILTEHQDGNHGGLHPRNRDFVSSGVRFVTAKHMNRDGSLDLETAPFISEKQAKGLRIGFARERDVLLAHNATVGPVALAPEKCENFIVGTSLTIYRGHPSLLLQEYLFLSLQSSEFQNQLFDAMKQTTRNQVPITRQRDFLLPVPPIETQKRIVQCLLSGLRAIEQAVIGLEAQRDAINALPVALLRRAFAGEV